MSIQEIVSLTRNKCTGCRSCEVVCSMAKEGMVAPEKARIRISIIEEDGLVFCTPRVCQQCEKPFCAEKCPVEAIEKDANTGAMAVNSEACSGCGVCLEECPNGAISMDAQREVALICDLCGGDPECIKTCPDNVLHYKPADKVMMVINGQGL